MGLIYRQIIIRSVKYQEVEKFVLPGDNEEKNDNIETPIMTAAITVPGGNKDSGKAIYAAKASFIIFAVSNAISLFTSTTSLLLFLSILTARYREEDFLYKLPKRLILGLTMLFLSVTSMMVAFSATLYLLFGQEKTWILITIAALTSLPIASFGTLQFPLLVDLTSSTYGRGIFVKSDWCPDQRPTNPWQFWRLNMASLKCRQHSSPKARTRKTDDNRQDSWRLKSWRGPNRALKKWRERKGLREEKKKECGMRKIEKKRLSVKKRFKIMSNNTNSSISNFCLKGLLEKDKLTGLNYVNWLRNLRIVLRMENKQRAIEEPLPAAPAAGASRAIREEYEKRLTESNEAACLMLATMVPELQKGMESLGAYDMANQLKDMFQRQARQERYDNVKALSECKMAPGSSVSVHVLKMKSYIDQLERLGFPISQELATDFILSLLSSSYEPFVLNYQMNNLEKTIMELHGMLKTAESNMAKSKPAAPVLAIREGGIKKKKKVAPVKGKGKGKAIQPNPKPKTKGQGKAESNIPQSKTPEDAVCFYCKEVGHWRRSCPKYLEELKKLKANGASTSGTYMIELHSTSTSNSWVLDTGCGTHICTNVQGLKRSRKVRRGELDLIMGNKQIASVDMIGNYELSFSSGLSMVLIDCCYSAEMARNIISFYALYKDGFDFGFDNGSILVYKNNVLYFKANPCHGIYETSITVRDNRSSIYNVESTQSKNGLDKSYLWHCRLGHISKKRITKLQSDGILESFDHTSNDECESCLLGKMTKAPFTGTCERGKDLLDIVHTDVCGPFRSATRHDERYFVTFTDDFSRYGYVYLIKHKSETIEVFRTFQNEIENQLNRKIKTLRSDRGGEYLSQEFQDHLRSCGIIAQLTPSRTPQHNGVADRLSNPSKIIIVVFPITSNYKINCNSGK
ncbi:hypothetical protein OSB04_012947 [Centaurea solstitialis]|uniref:Uncharacterized protein n=1 Tax=Centaurea solstitialis TaxID=347529 RepID=A0AA38TJU5_9ASTR|nr:hypothetical protein OSB04_012947 [Centaurea solstitialis]